MPTAPEEMTLKVIAHIHTAFPTKFGIPRQMCIRDRVYISLLSVVFGRVRPGGRTLFLFYAASL